MSILTNSESTARTNVKFGIGKRLMSAFGIVGSLSVLVSIVAWFSLSDMSENQKELTSTNVPAITGALLLANKTSQLVASAPLLNGALTNAEREDRLGEINSVIETALNQVNELAPLLKNEKTINSLKTKMNGLPPLIHSLNENVESRLTIAEQRRKLAQDVVNMRETIAKAIEPLASSITDKLIETSDKWFELLDESISKTKAGETVNPDTIALETAPIKAVSYHSSVLEFKNGANLMVGLLAEGSQSETQEGLTKTQEQFRASITAMVEPMGALAGESDITELTSLFNKLMQIGDRGDLNDNILKLRHKELLLKEEGKEILSQARELSNDLSRTVNVIVASVEEGMEQSIQSSEAKSKKTGVLLFSVAVIAILISAAIGWLYVAKNLIKRLLNLEHSMQSIADGDLKTRINRNGKDEISHMGAALAVLRNGLRETDQLKQKQEGHRVESEKQKRADANSLADEFDGSVGQAIGLLSEYVGDIRGKAQEMSEKSQEMLDETKEVSDASQVMSQDIGVVASSTEELSASISEISQQVANSTQVANEAVIRAEKMNGNIVKLETGSREIENVIGLINTIAEQTNLLALNATIEAARAGEAGKGFAVVASEVKNLANQTAGATDEIGNLIKDIQKEVNEAVEANKDITSIIGEIDQLSAGIAAAVEEQSAATAEISRTVSNAAEHVDLITSRVTAVSSDVRSNGATTTEVLDGVSHIDQQSSILSEKVSHFLKNVRAS